MADQTPPPNVQSPQGTPSSALGFDLVEQSSAANAPFIPGLLTIFHKIQSDGGLFSVGSNYFVLNPPYKEEFDLI